MLATNTHIKKKQFVFLNSNIHFLLFPTKTTLSQFNEVRLHSMSYFQLTIIVDSQLSIWFGHKTPWRSIALSFWNLKKYFSLHFFPACCKSLHFVISIVGDLSEMLFHFSYEETIGRFLFSQQIVLIDVKIESPCSFRQRIRLEVTDSSTFKSGVCKNAYVFFSSHIVYNREYCYTFAMPFCCNSCCIR